MPFKVLVAYFPAAHADDVPPFLWVLWAVGGLATAATVVIVGMHLVLEAAGQRRLMEEEGRVVPSYQSRVVRVIVCCPLPMCVIAYTTLFVPANAYFVELTIAIVAAFAVCHVTLDFVHALGDPPETLQVIERFPPKRWYCGVQCGGAFDPLCCIGLYAGGAFKLQLRHLRMALAMVSLWITAFVATAMFKYTANSYLTQTVRHLGGGWCESTGAWSDLQDVLNWMLILWCLPGLAGVTMLASAASLATGDEYMAKKVAYHAKAKADVSGTYLGIAIWRALLNWMAGKLVYPEPTVAFYFPFDNATVPETSSDSPTMHYNVTVRNESEIVYHTSFIEAQCAVYDKQVVSMYLFCGLITVAMALVAWANLGLYPPAEDTAAKLRAAVHESGDSCDTGASSSADSDGESTVASNRTPAHLASNSAIWADA